SLAALTLVHFGREQAIFTHHLAAPLPPRDEWAREPALVRRFTRLGAVTAPVIQGGNLLFRPFPLPADFDIRDPAARVELFGRACVRSVTGCAADYQVAIQYVLGRFERRKTRYVWS